MPVLKHLLDDEKLVIVNKYVTIAPALVRATIALDSTRVSGLEKGTFFFKHFAQGAWLRQKKNKNSLIRK